MSRKFSFQLFWAYAVEIIAASILYGLTVYVVGIGPLTEFVQRTADEWNDLTGILFSAAIAIWLTFVNIRGGLFGEFLSRNGGDDVYSRAFIAAMISFFLATVFLVACKGIDHFSISHAAYFLLLYSGINLLTMTRNATDFVMLYSTFNREFEVSKLKSATQLEVQSPGNESEP